MTLKTQLTHVRNLNKKGWAQGVFARDKDGESVALSSAFACKFCISGAAEVINPRYYDDNDQLRKVLWDKAAQMGYNSPSGFNDAAGRTKEDVIKFLDELIEENKEK